VPRIGRAWSEAARRDGLQLLPPHQRPHRTPSGALTLRLEFRREP
jgi:hypothetical protein